MDDDAVEIVVQEKSIEFNVEYARRAASDEDVVVGLRPEVVTLDGADDPDMECSILPLEQIGDRMLATIDGPEGELRATVAADRSLSKGTTVPITINKDGLYLFDSETMDLITKGGHT